MVNRGVGVECVGSEEMMAVRMYNLFQKFDHERQEGGRVTAGQCGVQEWRVWL